MKLYDLLSGLEILDTKGNINENLEIADVQYHSGKIISNSIFVAIKGHETDGHKYIKSAKDNGAVIAVVEEFIDIDLPMIKVADSRKALADLANTFFHNPSKELNVVGITATNGKTTTSFMTDAIFKEFGLETGIVGTVEVKYKDVSIPSMLTTPESRDLQEYTRCMVDAGVTDLIMEVSSHAQEMDRVKNMEYNIVSFNNLSREHIDQHGSFENYYEIKSNLIKNAKKDAVAILNFDEEMIKVLKDSTEARVLSYSIENPNEDFGIENLDLSSGYARFKFIIYKDIEDLNILKDSFEIELGVAGFSGVMNSVVAIIISLVRGIPKEIIRKSLKKFKGVERRFQMIYDGDFTVIDDHYANSRNIAVTLETIEKMNYNNFFMLYAIRGNRGVNLNRESAEETVKWLKKLKINSIFSTSSEETVTWKDKVSLEEKEVFFKIMDENNISVKHFERLDDAINGIVDKLEKNDLLLLAGCQGMDPGGRVLLENLTQNMSEEDKIEVMKILEGRAF